MTSRVNQPIDARPLAWVRSVCVGSTNSVKRGATECVIAPLTDGCTFSAIAAASGVSDQPFGDDETIRGALARAHAARASSDADLGVGIEGGVVELPNGGLRTCAWAAVVSRDGRSGVGGSLAMPLPDVVAQWIREGLELGDAMDRLVNERGTKRGKGAVGVLTAGLVDRQAAYEPLVTYALAPLLTPEYWTR